MSKLTEKKIIQTIYDYRLWIAALEQYLIDNNITRSNINNKLQHLKKQLNIIPKLGSMLDIHQKISYIDNSLNKIQRQLILSPTQ